jgi:hypothetical protein
MKYNTPKYTNKLVYRKEKEIKTYSAERALVKVVEVKGK